MKLRWFVVTCAFGATTFALGHASATKPTPALGPQVDRANVILTASVKEQRVVRKSKQQPDGSWSRARSLVKVSVDDVLKFDMPEDLEFSTESLTFTPGSKFILLLQASPVEVKTPDGPREYTVWNYIPGPTMLHGDRPQNRKAIEAAIAGSKR